MQRGADPRHDYGQYDAGDPRARISEAWRFTVIDGYSDGINLLESHAFNAVTFVCMDPAPNLAAEVSVIGTFGQLYAPIPMPRVGDSLYRAVTVVVPKGHTTDGL